MSEWISVQDRLPEPGVEVFVWVPDPRPSPIDWCLENDKPTRYIDHLDTDWLEPCGMALYFAENKGEISHWMPLPEPPK